MKTKNISNFVLKFIEANKDSKTISDNWNTDKNLNALKKILKKHKKDNKDVNKPKRGKSSYLYFCDDYRVDIKKENPTFTNKQLLTHLGVIWKKHKENDSDIYHKYENLARKDRERYTSEMVFFRENNDSSLENKSMSNNIDEKEKKKKGKKKDEPKIDEDLKNVVEEDDDEELKRKKKEKKIKKKNVDDEELKRKRDDEEEELKRREKEEEELKRKKVDEEELKIKKKKIEKDTDSGEEDEKAFKKFLKKRKNKFIEEYPDLNVSKILEKMKKRWASLSDEKKQKYKS